MTRSWIRSLALLSILAFAQTAWSEEGRVEVAKKQTRDPIVDARVGVGLMINPELLGINTSVEVRASRFFAVGPMFIVGFDNDQQIFLPAATARFILPASVMMERVSGWPNLEISFHTGFGAAIRNEVGFRFNDFAYHAGLDFDFYVIDQLTLGIGSTAIVTSSAVERWIGLVNGTVAYHF